MQSVNGCSMLDCQSRTVIYNMRKGNKKLLQIFTQLAVYWCIAVPCTGLSFKGHSFLLMSHLKVFPLIEMNLYNYFNSSSPILRPCQ